ncbi:hypothetical protein SynSYN20_00222 [Synechococcus sp. SYN20]|nr:hypothetical protein SynSYN20_00222 [Synechococcus sp. SYN20]
MRRDSHDCQLASQVDPLRWRLSAHRRLPWSQCIWQPFSSNDLVRMALPKALTVNQSLACLDRMALLASGACALVGAS